MVEDKTLTKKQAQAVTIGSGTRFNDNAIVCRKLLDRKVFLTTLANYGPFQVKLEAKANKDHIMDTLEAADLFFWQALDFTAKVSLVGE